MSKSSKSDAKSRMRDTTQRAGTKQQSQQRGNGNGSNKIATFEDYNSIKIEEVLTAYIPRVTNIFQSEDRALQFVHAAINIIAASEDLQKCSQRSVVGGILTASMMNLSLVKQMGQAHLVPFKNRKSNCFEAQFLIGYSGWVELMLRTDRVSAVDAQIVYEHDIFDVREGTEQTLVHRPRLLAERGKPVLVYAVIRYKDGTTKFEWLTIAEVIARHRDRSQAYQASLKFEFETPWTTDFDDMCKKTAIIKIRKYAGLSAQDQRHLAADNSMISIDDFDVRSRRLKLENLMNPDHTQPKNGQGENDDDSDNSDSSPNRAREESDETSENTAEYDELIQKLEELKNYSKGLEEKSREEFESYYTGGHDFTSEQEMNYLRAIVPVLEQIKKEHDAKEQNEQKRDQSKLDLEQ